jgi:hypothetical protein
LLALTVWCTLSVLFAAVHCRLCRYAATSRPPMDFGPKTWRTGRNRIESRLLGSDVADFFHSYAN